MAGNSRRWLMESLKKHLIPAFEAHGFRLVPLAGEDAGSSEIRTAFPFGRLRRTGPLGLELVEIQLDKYKAAFRLNIGLAPAEGLKDDPAVAPDDLWVHYLDRYYAAYSSPRFRRWFTVRRWFGPDATKLDFENLVADNLGLVREVEDVLRKGKIGRHIRMAEK